MPRAKKTVKVPEPASEPVTLALVMGEIIDVPIGKIMIDPAVLVGTDRSQAMGFSYGALHLLKIGNLNEAFIPRLFPRADGMFAWQGLTRRP